MLELHDVAGGYGQIQVLDGATLEVRAGEVVALMGPNGSGKSTLCRIVSGLLPSTRGSVRFDGREIAKLPPHRIARLGLMHVPEGHQDFGAMSVEENLLVGATIVASKPAVFARLQEIYEMFPRLRERRKQRAGLLSGGERRMLAMGRGLMSSPKLLLLDEPSQGLAPATVDEISDLVGAVREEGAAVLLVEQNLRLAAAVADRTYLLEHGSCHPLPPGANVEQALEGVYLGRATAAD